MHGLGAKLIDLSTVERDGILRLHLPEGGRITHEEHSQIVLPPGVYEIRHQRTMTQTGIWEKVRD